MKQRKILAADSETDPLLHGRVPKPFIWGAFDGKSFWTFTDTGKFVEFISQKNCICYCHNGGKFDFMFLLTYIKHTKVLIIKGRIVSMMIGKCELRCSFAIIPEALEKFGGKKKIDYWKMESFHRNKYWDEIVEYLYYDCKTLYEAVTQYRNIAGTQKTIASNALAFARKLGIDPGKTNHHFDTKYRRFFFGGRCECFLPGTHKNIYLLDIHSAYPYAMLQKHPTGSNFARMDTLDNLSTEEIQRSFIVLECMSYGAFPLRTRDGLIFPHEYNEFYITGWEYLTAVEFGIIDNIKIISVRVTDETIDFSSYVNHWFSYKAQWDKRINPVEYTIGKIMQNSLYGKLAQNAANYFDYKIMPAGSGICREPEENHEIKGFCKLCNEKMIHHGWDVYTEYEGHEIHRRESLWRYKFEFGVEWEAKPLYKNVATGASITGFTRAHLMRAMLTLGMENIIYCDTDGIAAKPSADLSKLPISDAIGDWELEDQSPIGHFAGKKLYGIQLSSKHLKDGKPTFKIAAKGSRLAEKLITREIDGHLTSYVEFDNATAYAKMERIVNGETVFWDNPAPSFSIDGRANFVRRNIRATAKVTP